MSLHDLPGLIAELAEMHAAASPQRREKIERALQMLGALSAQERATDGRSEPTTWPMVERAA